MAATETRVKEILDHQSMLENDRSTFDAHFREVAERILPRQNDFQLNRTVEGEKRTEKIFDSTGILALDRAASAIDSLITPSTQMYHRLAPEDDRLLEDRETMLYLDVVNKMLFRSRYRPMSNFASQAHECYVSLMAFGTLGMFIDDVLGVGLRYKSIPLVEMYIAENHAGFIDLVHRKFPMSARAAVQKWGNQVPDSIAKCVNPFQKFDFIHCVKPNMEKKRGRRDYRGMEFSSYYISMEGKKLMGEGGYRSMPYQVSRHVTAPREVYGRSPAMQVLPDIKMLNEMEKTIIRAAHKIVDPPLLAYGDGILSAFNTRPSAINYGGVDEQGRQLVHPLKTGSNLPIAFDMTKQKRETINDAFYVTLFQILVQNPQMTATEALIRAQEKGQLLAPTVGRQQSEFLGPTIDRELDIHAAAGVLPPMPRKLAMLGGRVKAVYTSPLTRLQRAEDGVAIMQTISAFEPLSEQYPEWLDNVDVDAAVREMWDIKGAPLKVLRAMEEVQQIRADRQKKQAQVQQQQEVVDASKAARGFAAAGKDAGLVGQPANGG